MLFPTLPTPALLLDRDVLQRNIDRMAEKASALGVALRPHIKTHKCFEIARLQRDQGARGITVATLAEARAFAAAGFDDITHAYPLDPGKFAPALDLASEITLRLTLDDAAVARALDTAAQERGQTVHIWLKVDCGNHRAGVDPASDAALQLAKTLHAAGSLTFDGILTHAGQAYRAGSAAELRRIAAHERDVMVSFARRLREADISVAAVSVGATPAMSAVDHLEGVDEARPGNYVFYDGTQLALGSCVLEDCAVAVLTTVVSKQPGRGQVVVDAGALALSHDPGPVHLDARPSRGAVYAGADPPVLHPVLRVVSVTQEHGIIAGDSPDDVAALSVGDRLRILPNHACLAAPLFDGYSVVQGGQVVDRWTIHRGRA